MGEKVFKKRILLVSEKSQAFLMRSLKGELEAKDIEVESISASINELSSIDDLPPFIIVQGGEFWEERIDTLVFLKDLCAEKQKKIMIFGHKDEIDKLKRTIPVSIIVDEYERPVEFSTVAERVDEKLEEYKLTEKNKMVLVVDDSGMMLRTIMGWLEGKYKVALANSAASAFNVINKERPDLILLDYEMPICSGAQFLGMLRSEDVTSDIPVIFLTSKGDAATVKSVIDLKPEGYLLKTTPSHQVVKTIDDFFAKKELKDATKL